ncbi:S41 family peptidase [Chitinophaga japonensis]|uniref:C-terminal processing protease CtpA/Prc n=1 Tax=Chitinophaga japonensis TaxID=104662 RepID=A0A562T4P9_CHIJA|nr:S41 family peptidase [Chitinophaga japonensis]TWI88214.1 C-terminal processing protease CtpA/Prc [Chitinophaga japonensis]
MSYNPSKAWPSYNHLLRKMLPVFLCIILTAACRKDNGVAPPTGPVTQQEINNWILDSMRYFYLWNQYLPAKADTQPTVAFFNSLKYTSDRFSVIYDPEDLSTYPKTMLYTFGIDFSVIDWPDAATGAIGVITYVLPGSPAQQQGLKRGDYFTRINGTPLNGTNAAALSAAWLAAGTGSLTPAAVNGDTITEGNAISLNEKTQIQYPIHELKALQVGGKTVGYLFYNLFHDAYSLELLGAFKQFKIWGVTELVLDLRYNSGGSVATAAMLTALIAPGINEETIFAKYSGNANLGQRNITFKSALSVPEFGEPISFSSLEPGQLSLPRVFILSGPQTASAAELVINNLKPFTEVVQIGQSTYGKDKGAVIISDMRSPKRIPWVLQPITYNLSNTSGAGGYTQGLTPQYVVNELSHQPLSPIGDENEPLLAKAISILSGNGRQTVPGQIISSSRVYFDSREQPAAGSIVRIPSALTR